MSPMLPNQAQLTSAGGAKRSGTIIFCCLLLAILVGMAPAAGAGTPGWPLPDAAESSTARQRRMGKTEYAHRSGWLQSAGSYRQEQDIGTDLEPTTGNRKPKVIPGLHGFGATTPAGRGGRVLAVTTLADSGPGSLRAALTTAGSRVVVFETSGTIHLNKDLNISHPYLTVAGQTAPSPGVTVKGATIWIMTHDVLFQHLRLRVGDDGTVKRGDNNRAALNIAEANTHDVVIDHCSLSWGLDAVMDIWGVDNVTVCNCIISEGLHNKGSIVGGGAGRISFIGNLLANSTDRNPYMRASSSVLVNNLVYNPREHGMIIRDNKNPVLGSVVGNVMLPGPSSLAGNALDLIGITHPKKTRIYVADNDCPQRTADPWSCVGDETESIKSATPPVWPTGLKPLPSAAVKEEVLAHAGARPADRDPVDQRLIAEVRSGGGRIITSQRQVGSWPLLAENRHQLSLPADPAGDADEDGYTNLEEWLHDLAAEVEGRAGWGR